MGETVEREPRPVGYWLKHLDRLLEAAFARALAAEGLTRRHWQVLDTLRVSPATAAELDAALEPFLGDAPAAAATVASDLAGRGWVAAPAAGRWALTEPGRRAHARLHERIVALRRRVRHGVTDQEYRTLTDTLRRMAANLESAAR